MSRLHFHLGEVAAARQLVLRYHYSGRWPGGNTACVVGTWHEDGGLFGDSGEAVAACVFGIPASSGWSQPVLELVRLVRRPDVRPQLSGLVSATSRWAHRKGWPLLVSFADATHDHHGGIYQACSWNYHGQRAKRMDGLIIDGVFIPGRTLNTRYGTQSATKLAERGIASEPHWDAGKHLYWRADGRTGKRMAESLKLLCRPYPKPHVNDGTAVDRRPDEG